MKKLIGMNWKKKKKVDKGKEWDTCVVEKKPREKKKRKKKKKWMTDGVKRKII